MTIADTSGLIAFFSESGSQHAAVTAWIGAHDPVMIVSPYVLVEVDYLVATRKGVDADWPRWPNCPRVPTNWRGWMPATWRRRDG